MCRSCTPNNIHNFLNYTLTDSTGSSITLSNCASQCVDVNLKNTSIYAVNSITYTDFWTQFYNLLESLIEPFNDDGLRNALRSINCDVSTPVGQTYTGSGLLLGGIIIDMILCLILRGRKDSIEDTK